MPTLRKALRDRLSAAEKVALLCVGSDLRADDAAGVIAADELARLLARRKKRPHARIFLGSTAPENLTGEIRRYNPSHLVIIDTADLRKKPGSIFIFRPEDVGSGVSFSTHKMPAKVLVDYLVASIGCHVTIVGIQPKNVDFGKPPCRAVAVAARRAARLVAEALR